MGNAHAHPLPSEQIQNIVENTNFTSRQVTRLYERFQRLDKDQTGFLTKEDFLKIPELAINPLADRIIDMFLMQPKNPHRLGFFGRKFVGLFLIKFLFFFKMKVLFQI